MPNGRVCAVERRLGVTGCAAVLGDLHLLSNCEAVEVCGMGNLPGSLRSVDIWSVAPMDFRDLVREERGDLLELLGSLTAKQRLMPTACRFTTEATAGRYGVGGAHREQSCRESQREKLWPLGPDTEARGSSRRCCQLGVAVRSRSQPTSTTVRSSALATLRPAACRRRPGSWDGAR